MSRLFGKTQFWEIIQIPYPDLLYPSIHFANTAVYLLSFKEIGHTVQGSLAHIINKLLADVIFFLAVLWVQQLEISHLVDYGGRREL